MSFINNAHNDYLELLFEMGAAATFLITAFILLYIYGWVKLWGKAWNQLHFIQNAAGVGIFILLLHSLTDFNLHTPANMIAFAFLCGLFFRQYTTINNG
jgi:O-antigen ligase